MRALHLNGVGDGDDGGVENSIFNIPVDLPRRVSPVRELVLLGSSIQRGLPETIAACAHLEHFEYQHHNQVDCGEDTGTTGVDLSALRCYRRRRACAFYD